MLVLRRKIGQRLVIADNVIVEVLEYDRGYVVLGVTAPRDVQVDREEIYRLKAANEGRTV